MIKVTLSAERKTAGGEGAGNEGRCQRERERDREGERERDSEAHQQVNVQSVTGSAAVMMPTVKTDSP